MKSEDLLAKWQEETCRAQTAHFNAASRLERLKYLLGISVIILSTFVGSSVFATLQKETNTRIKIGIAIASIASAILAAIQTFLGHAERAEKHRLAAVRYGTLKKEIELIQTSVPGDPAKLQDDLNSLLERRNKLSEDAPTVPRQIWAQLDKRTASEAKTVGQ